MQLALENMTKSTVSPPPQQIGHSTTASGVQAAAPGTQRMLGTPSLVADREILPIFSLSYHQPLQRDSIMHPFYSRER